MRRELSQGPIELKEVGIRPGEKLHEVLVSEFEAKNTYQLGNNYYVILPDSASDRLRDTYKNLQKITFSSYSSNSSLMSSEEIKRMLTEGGFLK